MKRFIDLPVSVFDPKFTLNPYRYLNAHYADENIIGFASDNMNFLFKFDDCREVMFSKSFSRPAADDESISREIEYAKKYPARANYFQLNFTYGEPDLKLKSLMVRLMTAISESATAELMDPVCKPLASHGRLENYIEKITYLPMALYLDVCGLEYERSDLPKLHQAGCDFLRSIEGQEDEALIALSDKAAALVGGFIDSRFDKLTENDFLFAFLKEGRESGISEDKLRANLGSAILISLSNTFGVSSAFVLRSLIHNPDALQTLRNNPELCDKDSTVTELLRLNNHVKALSRSATEDCHLGNYQVTKGEVFYLYFPGLNMDPKEWREPEKINFEREFTSRNNIIFGGSIYMCIGKKLTFAAMKSLLKGFIKYLPDEAKVIEDEIEVDGSWLAERIITKMVIDLP